MAPRVISAPFIVADSEIAVLADASTATATYNEATVVAIPVQSTGHHFLQFTVAGLTGTSVNAKLQHSVDGVNFVDVTSGAFSAQTTNGTTFLSVPGPVAPNVRVVLTYVAVTAATVTVYDYVTAK